MQNAMHTMGFKPINVSNSPNKMPPKNVNTTEFASTNITQEAADHLLPYLALGYGPVSTRAGGRECGYYAMVTSLRAALELNNIAMPAREITVDYLRQLNQGAAFRALVDEAVAGAGVIGNGGGNDNAISAGSGSGAGNGNGNALLDLDRGDNLRDLLLSEDYLHINAMSLLLTIVNRENNWFFRLGHIQQGFRGVWNAAEGRLDPSVDVPTVAFVDGYGLARPAIWVWNDNAQDRARRRSPSGNDGGLIAHWEGFGPPEASDAAHRHTVQSWDLGARVRADVNPPTQRVWRVLKGRKAKSATSLETRRGHFVRSVPVPDGMAVINDREYVRLCAYSGNAPADEGVPKNVGWVPRRLLVEVAMHPNAPQLGVPVEISFANRSGPTVPFRISRMIHGIIKAPESSTTAGYDISSEFQNGLPIAAPINGEEDHHGDLFLDARTRDGLMANVTSIGGIQGQVHLRNLANVESPWGWLSTRLPTIDVNAPLVPAQVNLQPDEMTLLQTLGPEKGQTKTFLIPPAIYTMKTDTNDRAMDVKSIRQLWQDLGGKEKTKETKIRKQDAIIAVRELIRQRATELNGSQAAPPSTVLDLPLYILNTDLEITRPGTVRFLTGEVVRLWTLQPSENGEVRILDFEGSPGFVQFTDLTKIQNAFGLALRAERLADEIKFDWAPIQPRYNADGEVFDPFTEREGPSNVGPSNAPNDGGAKARTDQLNKTMKDIIEKAKADLDVAAKLLAPGKTKKNLSTGSGSDTDTASQPKSKKQKTTEAGSSSKAPTPKVSTWNAVNN